MIGVRRRVAVSRAERLMALETHRDGPLLPPSGVTNASALLLVELGRELPSRAERTRWVLRRRTEAVCAAYFRTVVAQLDVIALPAVDDVVVGRRRAVLGPHSGFVAAAMLGTAHLAGVLDVDAAAAPRLLPIAIGVAVAVVGPALVAGRVFAVREWLPADPLPRAVTDAYGAGVLLAAASAVSAGLGALYGGGGWWSVLGATLLGCGPPIVALVEMLAANPSDRLERQRRRAARRARLRRSRVERRCVRALRCWSRAHRRLRRSTDRIAAVGDESARQARAVLWRVAARFGWRAASVPLHWPDPPLLDRVLELPREVLDRLPPDPEVAQAAARQLRGAR